MQTDLITKLDKKLQDSQDQLKVSKKKEKQLEIKLSDAIKDIHRLENEKAVKNAAISYKCRECNFCGGSEAELLEHKREKKPNFELITLHTIKMLKKGHWQR